MTYYSEAGKGGDQRPTDHKKFSSGYDLIWGKKDEPEEFEEDDEDDSCSWCGGCGEGMYDGAACNKCGGSGIEPVEKDDDV